MILNQTMKNKALNLIAKPNTKYYSVVSPDLKSRFDSNLISRGGDFQKLTIVR